MIPWKSWFAAWLRAGRSAAEFWSLSPAQVAFTFDALGMTKKRGSGKDLVSMVGALGALAAIEGSVPKSAGLTEPGGRWL